MFAHLPILGLFGIEVRVGGLALPLLKPDAKLDPEAARLLGLDELRQVNDTSWGFQPSALTRMLPRVLAAGLVGVLARYLLA